MAVRSARNNARVMTNVGPCSAVSFYEHWIASMQGVAGQQPRVQYIIEQTATASVSPHLPILSALKTCQSMSKQRSLSAKREVSL
ncbi:MAG: hypothetical protein ACLQLG_01290 [Thermoguttaceae bacterium]